MEQRLNILIGMFGSKGTGKTRYSIDTLIKNSNKKVLVYDVFPHPDYNFLPTVNPDKLPRWRKGNYRIIGDPDEMLPHIAEHAANCLLILEDSKRYTPDNPTKWMRKLIIEHRNRNIDVVFQYHNFSDCSDYLVKMLNWIGMFKTNDNLEFGITPRKWAVYWSEIEKLQKEIRAACEGIPDNQRYKHKRFISL